MTFRAMLPALGTVFCLALPAQALDLDAMSDAERDAFGTAIRDYLLENPQVIMEAVAVLESRDQAAQEQMDRDLIAANKADLFEDDQSWVGGNPDGDITLVEFLDYRCGYCRRAFPEVEQLIELDGNIRLVIKEFPILGEESEMASRFALATKQVAGDDAYKSMHDALMSLNGPVNETSLSRLAGSLGLDADAIFAGMDSAEVDLVLAKNRDLGKRLQINGTPSFVMNDQMLRGYLPLDGMLEMADTIRSQ